MANRFEAERLPTLADLIIQPAINPDTLVRVIEVYASTGTAILAGSLIDIMKRTPLDTPHLGRIGLAAIEGEEKQLRRGFPLCAAQYGRVEESVLGMLNRKYRNLG